MTRLWDTNSRGKVSFSICSVTANLGFAVVWCTASTNSAAGKNSNSGSGYVHAKLNAMPASQLNNASRWQQPNPALKWTCLRHTA